MAVRDAWPRRRLDVLTERSLFAGSEAGVFMIPYREDRLVCDETGISGMTDNA